MKCGCSLCPHGPGTGTSLVSQSWQSRDRPCSHLPNHSGTLREHTVSLCLSGSENICMYYVRGQCENLTTTPHTSPCSCPETRKAEISPSLGRGESAGNRGLGGNRGSHIPQSLGRRAGASNSSPTLGSIFSK